MVHEIFEILWVHGMLRELGFNSQGPMSLYCDNKATIGIVHNPIQHDKTKNIEVDMHFIKEKVQSKKICIPFVKTKD